MNIGDVLDAITQVMARDRLIFVPVALAWLRGLVLLVFAWIVVDAILEHRGIAACVVSVKRLLILYLVLFSILINWAFVIGLVTGEVHDLRTLVEHGQETQIFVTVTGITTEVRSAMPLLPSVRDWIVIIIIEVVLSVFTAALYFVLTFGFIASAMAQIIGPLFVALRIVPGFGWMLSGWIRSFIGYSLYPLFGAIYCDVVGQVLLYFVQAHPAPWSANDLGVMSAGFVMVFVGLCVGIWRVPRFIADVLGGYTGTSAVPHVRLLRGV